MISDLYERLPEQAAIREDVERALIRHGELLHVANNTRSKAVWQLVERKMIDLAKTGADITDQINSLKDSQRYLLPEHDRLVHDMLEHFLFRKDLDPFLPERCIASVLDSYSATVSVKLCTRYLEYRAPSVSLLCILYRKKSRLRPEIVRRLREELSEGATTNDNLFEICFEVGDLRTESVAMIRERMRSNLLSLHEIGLVCKRVRELREEACIKILEHPDLWSYEFLVDFCKVMQSCQQRYDAKCRELRVRHDLFTSLIR